NFIVGTDKNLILEKILVDTFDEQGEYYGDGKAGENIVNALLNY
ncbi:MAG: UDP-N-acetyl glucosamine 2-epimerase, partial [Chlorobi bacterium]|nr:UDP-N-acetyl glucosamine 2-epimerase [Chlorobiota bacterium]